MKAFEQYLKERYAPSSVKMYLREVAIYLKAVHADQASYAEVMDYVGQLRERNYAVNNIRRIMASIRVYHQFLVETGVRMDNPCSMLFTLRDQPTPRPLHSLFSPSELKALLYRENRYGSTIVRNKVLLGLLIYQGLSVQELVNLQVREVDLTRAMVHVRHSRKHAARDLPLEASQIMDLQTYIHRDRPALLDGKTQTSTLLLNMRGRGITADDVHYLVSTYAWLYPDRQLTAGAIRASVMVNKLKQGEDISSVQYFGGFKWLSSVERFKPSDISRLLSMIDDFHPMR